ncbi:MAG: hypothetical protein CMO01_11405 [Thalassobius sp.]|nr:hypothetical protein [Thalassovita sp.]
MGTTDLKRIWSILADEKLIDKSLAKENILEIITQKGHGVISKLQRKHQLDFNRYLGVVLFMPFVILFLIYRDRQGLLPQSSSGLGGPYVIPFLIEAFMIYALMSLKRNMNFMKRTYNAGTLKESLTKMKSYFEKITNNMTGTLLLKAILAFVEVDTLYRIGGVENISFSPNGSYIFESYLLVFIIFLIIAVPFIVKLDAKRYAGVLQDLDQTIEELNKEE